LYRQDEFLAASEDEWVYVPEGEAKADRLRCLGFVAASALGGASRKWDSRYSDLLKSRKVVVLADNDEPGQKHARDVAGSSIGKASMVKVVNLPGLPHKGDILDWLAQGHTADELQALVEDALEWIPEQESPTKATGLRLTALGDLMTEDPEQIDWVLEDTLPAAGMSLLVAKPKVGKSTLARCLALAVARGEEFLGRSTSQGVVVYLALEKKGRRFKDTS